MVLLLQIVYEIEQWRKRKVKRRDHLCKIRSSKYTSSFPAHLHFFSTITRVQLLGCRRDISEISSRRKFNYRIYFRNPCPCPRLWCCSTSSSSPPTPILAVFRTVLRTKKGKERQKRCRVNLF